MVDERMKQIVNEIAMTATDPRTKLPHPHVRIENALDEARFKADPFLSVERQVQDAVDVLKPIIPLQFITIRLAFKVPGKDYGGVSQLLRDSMDDSLNHDAVEIAVVNSEGYQKLDHETTLKHLEKIS